MSKEIVRISSDRRGTHAMQSLIELINLPEEEQILEESLKDDVINMSLVLVAINL